MQSSSDIQSLGDGSDNAGNAATQGLKAAKQAGKMAGNAAAKGAEEATKAAAGAAVKAGVQTGKAVANVAAGTAAGGPWGAIISAAWSMRHTLFKVLVSICLVIVFIVVIIVSLPSIIFQNIFGLDDGASFNDSYNDLSYSITDVILVSYIIFQLVNISLFALLRKLCKDKNLWLRSFGSTIISQIFTAITFYELCFFDLLSQKEIWTMILIGLIIKSFIALVEIPFLYFIKKLHKENVPLWGKNITQ